MPNLHLFASVGNNAAALPAWQRLAHEDLEAKLPMQGPSTPGSSVGGRQVRHADAAAAGEKSESENALAADFNINSRTRDGDGRDGRVRGGVAAFQSVCVKSVKCADLFWNNRSRRRLRDQVPCLRSPMLWNAPVMIHREVLKFSAKTAPP